MKWLAEKWTGDENGNVTDEQWMVPRGGVMLGINRTVYANGKTSFEFMRIAETQDGLVFYASPQGQPATPFRTTETGSAKIVFENLKNDFPQRIIYQRTGDTLHARIEGEVKGQPQSMQWIWQLAK